jgi:uncharacterized protein
MSKSILKFTDDDVIGKVISVDTNRVVVEVGDHKIISRISVAGLVAVEGSRPEEYLIGMVERITRDKQQKTIDDEENNEGEIPIRFEENDVVWFILIGTYHKKLGTKNNVFKRGADSFPQIDRKSYVIDADNLQSLMGLLSAEIPDTEQLRLGTFVADERAVAVADGNRLFQRHAALLGSTGSGKSWCVALILEQAHRLSHPNIIVFDLHGEYKSLSTTVNPEKGFAQYFEIAGPNQINTSEALFLPHWLLNREEMLSVLLDRNDQNAPNQATRFTSHALSLKKEYLTEQKLEAERESITVDSPIPYEMTDLLSRLTNDDTEMVPGKTSDKQGPFFGKLSRFISRLEAKLDDKRYSFMFRPPSDSLEYDWLENLASKLMLSGKENPGVKIIDFSSVPSDILPIVISVFARLIYDIQFWKKPESRTPISFICDEAHLYIPTYENLSSIESKSVDIFEKIAKEGRKYGVSLMIVSQRPSDVNKTVLSQCNNFIVLRLTNDQDQGVVRKFMPESMAGLTHILPLLDIGEALVLGDAILLPSRIRLDTPNVTPDSATRQFWSEWNSQEPSKDSIKNAIESLRRQSRSTDS